MQHARVTPAILLALLLFAATAAWAAPGADAQTRAPAPGDAPVPIAPFPAAPKGEVLVGGSFFSLTTPEGYVLADEEDYGNFLENTYDSLEAVGMTLQAAYIPENIDMRARKDPSTTVDKYLAVMTYDDLDKEIITPKVFEEMQATFRANPDMLGKESSPGTAAAPRRIGPLAMTGTAVFYSFRTQNDEGKAVGGAMALVHTEKTLVYVCLYALTGKSEAETVEALRAELPGVVAGLAIPPPDTRDGKPFIYAGLACLLFAFLLGLFFLFRERKAP
ncbi:exported hypothetical protein [uncultured delta proteobacterium]|uniref:Uncharacterized protein n=1 Tax=uncultured delta proteobacterium TaxID=34034 RepID=A0A212KF52_9DELT|nr:exported hypothetical protein [uncultured delta proteobacterium]